VWFRLSVLVALPKNCWPTILGSVVIQLYAGECTPSIDRALRWRIELNCDVHWCTLCHVLHWRVVVG